MKPRIHLGIINIGFVIFTLIILIATILFLYNEYYKNSNTQIDNFEKEAQTTNANIKKTFDKNKLRYASFRTKLEEINLAGLNSDLLNSFKVPENTKVYKNYKLGFSFPYSDGEIREVETINNELLHLQHFVCAGGCSSRMDVLVFERNKNKASEETDTVFEYWLNNYLVVGTGSKEEYDHKETLLIDGYPAVLYRTNPEYEFCETAFAKGVLIIPTEDYTYAIWNIELCSYFSEISEIESSVNFQIL